MSDESDVTEDAVQAAWQEAIDAHQPISITAWELTQLFNTIGALQLAVGYLYGATGPEGSAPDDARKRAFEAMVTSTSHSSSLINEVIHRTAATNGKI